MANDLLLSLYVKSREVLYEEENEAVSILLEGGQLTGEQRAKLNLTNVYLRAILQVLINGK